jgi:hypothetical protein
MKLKHESFRGCSIDTETRHLLYFVLYIKSYENIKEGSILCWTKFNDAHGSMDEDLSYQIASTSCENLMW